MKLYWRKEGSIFVSDPQKIYVKLSKNQPIDVFTAYIFQSFTWFRNSSSMKIWWNFMPFFINLIPPVRIYGQSYKKNLVDLPYDYPQVLSCLLMKQSNSFRFLRQYYHYYQRYINLAAKKIHKHFYQILLSRICLDELCFRSNAFQCQWCQCGQ